MMTKQQASCKRQADRGVSILLIAVSMIFILGMAGLSIDLASLYVGRSQAQRAADAGALAAASALAHDATCVNGGGGTISGACQTLARQRAKAVGDLNLIAGVSPDIQLNTDVTFISTSSGNPQVQVVASRDTTHNNPMPTFFVKIFGIDSANVSAKAVAEAYTSSGAGPSVGSTCVKPWLIPNCDSGNTNQGQAHIVLRMQLRERILDNSSSLFPAACRRRLRARARLPTGLSGSPSL